MPSFSFLSTLLTYDIEPIMALPSRIAVIGGGQMGLGIAYVSALHAKAQVQLVDADPSQLEKAVSFFGSLLAKDVKKGKISEIQAKEARERLQTVSSIEKLASGSSSSPQMAIEAVTERLSIKQSIFSSLAQHLPEDAILCTNTSSISISKIAASALRKGEDPAKSTSPSRAIGLHFMNPVPVLKLVELIPSLQTSPQVIDIATRFAEACGKTVVQSKDTPGFIANRLLMPYINEAIIALSEGIGTKEGIDTTMRLGMAHPMGPLTLADFIGLDTCYYIMQTLHSETGDSKYRPAVLLGRMVDAGWMGKKSGKGFYE